jgi:hypothetical protein
MELRNLSEDQLWDYENGFYWFSPPSRINKLLAHYEIYQLIKGVPGDIFELGVFKGASLIRFATFRALFENDDARRIVGFDAFGKFPTENLELAGDLEFIERFEGGSGPGLTREETERVLDLKGFRNVQLVEGNVFETLPAYLEQNPHCRISLLHLDMDVKEPTAYALDLLFEKLVSGGIVVVDDYNSVVGATDAVDEFLKDKRLNLKKLPHYNVPAYFMKE